VCPKLSPKPPIRSPESSALSRCLRRRPH
jgi:hypothetical protein